MGIECDRHRPLGKLSTMFLFVVPLFVELLLVEGSNRVTARLSWKLLPL
jgi:hypothetical protein